MKKKRNKKLRLRSIAMLLAVSMMITAMPPMSSLAKEVTAEGDQTAHEAWSPEELQLPNTEGDLSLCRKAKLQEVLSDFNGDIFAFKYNAENREDNPFIKKLKGTVQPSFGNVADYINGLVFCLHGIWGNQIEVKSYTTNGNTYSGVLTFTLYDHFGLDQDDLTNYNIIHKGFAAWYILQHSKTYAGEYKPFVTMIQFEIPFSGTL